MSSIFVGAKEANLGFEDANLDFETGKAHSYLVYENDTGARLVTSLTDVQNDFFPPSLSFDVEQINTLYEQAEEPHDPNRVERPLDLGGRNADAVWTLITEHAEAIKDEKLDYNPLTQNSNSFVASLLNVVGLDFDHNLPGFDGEHPSSNPHPSDYPGLHDLLDFDYQLVGTASHDIIRGAGGDDRLWGNGADDMLVGNKGSDTLYGDTGNDRLWGNDGNDVLMDYSGVNRLSGGAGDDSVNGIGLLLGGSGNDWVSAALTSREIAGTGADAFVFGVVVQDGVAATITADDFRPGEGDKIVFHSSTAGKPGDWTGLSMFQAFDTNGDGVIKGDGSDAFSNVHNGALELHDWEDTVAFKGVDHINAIDWIT